MKRIGLLCFLTMAIAGCKADDRNWYEKSFYLLHEDHHTKEQFEVGRDADADKTAQLIRLSKPDIIQIHAKGNPGWTTYPTKIGHTPPKLARDVLGIWRNIANEEGYSFSAYYNIGRDGVIMKRRPEWNRVKADGTPIERALCYHSGVAEEYLWPMIREIMQKYQPDGFWFDGSCFTVRVCYCQKCQRRFKHERGLEVPKNHKERGWKAYQEMHRQIFRELIHDTAAVIREINPNCLVAFNWAYSLRMPEKPDPGIDYLTGDIPNGVEGLSAEAHLYDSQGLPFDLMTNINTVHQSLRPDGVHYRRWWAPKPREQIEQEMAIIIANGGRYFAWDTPTPQSGLVPERHEFLGRVVAPFLRARQQWCLRSKRIPEVSVLYNADNHYALTQNSPTVFVRGDNRINGTTDTLTRLHLNYEIIPDWRLAEQDIRSPLLIVEHPKVLTEETIESLIEYVRNGGTLLMTGMGAGHDQRIQQICGIAKCTGSKGPEQLTVKLAGTNTTFEHWLFRLKLSTAKQLTSVSDSQGQTYPIVTRNAFGRGQACYVPIPLLTRHGNNVVPADFVKLVFDLVLPSAQRLVVTNVPDSVEVVLRQNDNIYVLHLVNHALGKRETIKGKLMDQTKITDIPPAPPCHVSVQLPSKPSAVHLQPAGERLNDWRFENGRLEADVPQFDIHQMLVIQMAK